MTRYAPLWEQAGSYAASIDRRLVAAVAGSGAYPLVNGCAVTVAAGTMNLNIAAGGVVVPTQNNTGSTYCYSDAVEVVASPTAPASGLNRIDVIVCQARGNDIDGGANNDFLFQVVAGAAVTAGTEVAPATPAGAVALAQIRVIGASASLNAANLLDRRITQPWDQPWGQIGYNSTANGQGSITNTATDVVGMNVTFNAIANRRYRTSPKLEVSSTTANDIVVASITTGSNAGIDRYEAAVPTVGLTMAWTAEETCGIPNLPAGVNTRKVQLQRAAGSGILTVIGGILCKLLVEDIGPAGAPVL